MLNDIFTGISVGVGLALITILGKKFSEVIILKRDLTTCWKRIDTIEKKIEHMDDRQEKINTKVAIIESRDKH